MFARGNAAPEGRQQASDDRALQSPATGVSTETLEIAENTGWRYARVSGDFNPIHLTARTAKMFGFKQAVAHGMWSMGRCLAAAAPHLPNGKIQVDTQFKLPVYMPSQALARTWRREAASIFPCARRAATACTWRCRCGRCERRLDGVARRHRVAHVRAEADAPGSDARASRADHSSRVRAHPIMVGCVRGVSSCSKALHARSSATRWRSCAREVPQSTQEHLDAERGKAMRAPTIIVVRREDHQGQDSRDRAGRRRRVPPSRTCCSQLTRSDTARCGRPARPLTMRT